MSSKTSKKNAAKFATTNEDLSKLTLPQLRFHARSLGLSTSAKTKYEQIQIIAANTTTEDLQKLAADVIGATEDVITDVIKNMLPPAFHAATMNYVTASGFQMDNVKVIPLYTYDIVEPTGEVTPGFHALRTYRKQTAERSFSVPRIQSFRKLSFAPNIVSVRLFPTRAKSPINCLLVISDTGKRMMTDEMVAAKVASGNWSLEPVHLTMTRFVPSESPAAATAEPTVNDGWIV